MKKSKNFLSSEKMIKKVRIRLEEKTEKDFRAFDRSKQKVRELAHVTFLD
jgi:hypothetical protein